MPKLIQKDFSVYKPVETWYCESVSELANIPENVPAGSIAEILTNDGLTLKMKNSSGTWIDI